MTLKECIEMLNSYAKSARNIAKDCINKDGRRKLIKTAEKYEQEAEWLTILKKAKFEYDEAWRIITHPTPDATYADRNRAQMILDTFRNSLGKME